MDFFLIWAADTLIVITVSLYCNFIIIIIIIISYYFEVVLLLLLFIIQHTTTTTIMIIIRCNIKRYQKADKN